MGSDCVGSWSLLIFLLWLFLDFSVYIFVLNILSFDWEHKPTLQVLFEQCV